MGSCSGVRVLFCLASMVAVAAARVLTLAVVIRAAPAFVCPLAEIAVDVLAGY